MAQLDKPKHDKPVGIGEMLRRADIGSVLYLNAKDSAISAYAAGAGVKVKTERMLAIHPATKEVEDITRVTVESRKGDTTTPAPTRTAPPSTTPTRRVRPEATKQEPEATPQPVNPMRRRPITNLRNRR